MKHTEVFGLGALNVDHLYRVERIIGDGETIVEEHKLSPGGSAANTIYGLARLGISTGFVGAIGDDDEGRMLLGDFEKTGVDNSQIKVKRNFKTGSVLCLTDRSSKRSLYVLPGANNQLTADDLDLTYINQAKMLHLSSFVDDRQFEMLLELIGKSDLSVRLSFSPGTLYASKGLRALAPILKRTHLLFLNESEIKLMTAENMTTGAQMCLEQGCHIVVVTLGRGARHKKAMAASYIRDKQNEYFIKSGKPSATSTLETTGAGDAFATGFLYGLLNDRGLQECGELGHIVAQFAIAKTGAREGLPTLAELADRYRELTGKEW